MLTLTSKYNKYFICDEIFSGLNYNNNHIVAASIHDKDIDNNKTVVLFGASKSFNTSGLNSTFIIVKN